MEQMAGVVVGVMRQFLDCRLRRSVVPRRASDQGLDGVAGSSREEPLSRFRAGPGVARTGVARTAVSETSVPMQ